MKPEFFWKSWDNPYKSIYQILLLIFSATVLAYTITYVSGSTFVINWEITNIINPVKTLFKTYHLGLFNFPIYVDNYIIQQNFVGSELQVHAWPAYVLLIWMGICISIMLALITDLSRFWFLVSVALFTLLLVGLKLDYLVLFNQYNKISLVVALILYFPALYFFHFIKRDIGFVTRLLVHLCATAIFALIIYKFSYVSLPFLHLANYGIYVPLILTILFVFMIGHELISGILRIISSGSFLGEKNGLFHFLFISVVYLVNVALLLLKNTRTFELDIYLIGAFLLLTAATVVGIWGYKSREITYKAMFSFAPQGAFLYILLAITAHLTLAFFFISGNDFFVEVVEDAIVFSQLAYGVMFVVYFLANFFDIFRENGDVSKILYKPMRMPYFTSRLAGLIAILGLFFRFHMTPYHQAIAGFYSGIGDVYMQLAEDDAAREYYKLSNVYSSTSHRANYAMATVEKKAGQTEEEITYLKEAISKNPTEFAYANLAAKLKDEKRYFEALFLLQDGLEKFPKSGPLMNNQGLVYQDLDNIDSAYYQFTNSANYRQSRDKAEANIFAFLRIEGLSIKSDTLDVLLKETKYLPAVNNLVVLANELDKKTDDLGTVQFGNSDNAKIDQIIYNYNKTINHPELVDSVYLEDLRVFYDSGNTSWFQDNMNKASALALFNKGNISTSFQKLNLLAVQNPEDEYNSLLGRLSLSLFAPELAVDYFKNSFQQGHLDVAPELAFAYMESDELEKAVFLWKQIELSGDSTEVNMAQKMITVIEATSIDDVLYADTQTRYLFIAYRSREFDTEKLEALVLSFENEDVRALSLINLLDIYLELRQKEKAFTLLEKLGELNINTQHTLEMINLGQCRYAYRFHENDIMDRLRLNLQSTLQEVNNYLQLFNNMAEQDSSLAIHQFVSQAYQNPFFEPGVFEAVQRLNVTGDQVDQAYDLLLNAVNFNPFSVELKKAYAIQCLRSGLNSYATETFNELRQIMNSVAFQTFEVEFNKAMEENEAKASTW